MNKLRQLSKILLINIAFLAFPFVVFADNFDTSGGYYNINPCEPNGSLHERFLDTNYNLVQDSGNFLNLNSDCSNWNNTTAVNSLDSYFNAHEGSPYPNPPYIWAIDVYTGIGSTGTLTKTYYIYWNGSSSSNPPPIETQIYSVTPANNATVSSSTLPTFQVTGYIKAEDITGTSGFILDYTYENLSNYLTIPHEPIYFQATTSGNFSYTVTGEDLLSEGNYRSEVTLRKSYLGIIALPNFLGGTQISTSSNWIVGTSTTLGSYRANIGQQMINLTNNFSTTTFAGVTNMCNPFNSSFSIGDCSYALIIPDSQNLKDNFINLRDGAFSRFPIGYATRFITILSNTATGTLPAYTATIYTSPTTEENISFDIGDMVIGGGSLMAGITDSKSGKNTKEILEPLIQMFVALWVIFIIFSDIMGLLNHKR